jgi:hypothetical protein
MKLLSLGQTKSPVPAQVEFVFRPELTESTGMAGILSGTKSSNFPSSLAGGMRYTGRSGWYWNGIDK